MATVTCGWCMAWSHMTLHGEAIEWRPEEHRYGDDFFLQAAFICDGCGQMSVCIWRASRDVESELGRSYRRGPLDESWTRWIPLEGHHKEFPDVPDEVAATATEAWTCHTAGAYRGAVMLARAVVEAAAKAKDITSGTLEKKIEKLSELGVIRAIIADHAHDIRVIGNSAAHGDLDDPITKEESEEVLYLMGELLHDVWQTPTRGGRFAAARKAGLEQR